MKIAVIGPGSMGAGLGRHLAAAGHEVRVGSRDAERAREKASEIGASFGGGYHEAAAEADALLLTIPWWGVDEVLGELGDAPSGAVLIDVTNPYKDDTFAELVEFSGSSGAEEIQRKVPGVRVVKAWNTVFAPVVASGPDFGGQAASVFVAGDDAEAKETVMRLARELGYDPVDAGPLSSARFIEPLAGLMVRMAYGLGRGPNQALKLLTR
jgi:hypothetical protein